MCAGLCLGLAPVFWSQALVEEVYAVAALAAAKVMLMAAGSGASSASGIDWGISMGAHAALVFLAPVVVWGSCSGGEVRARQPRQRMRRIV